MKKILDLWEEVGELAEDEMFRVLTTLFTLYEKELRDSENAAALKFFHNLEVVIEQARQCNSNRR